MKTRLALDAPQADLVLLTGQMVRDTVVASRDAGRKRMIQPIHRSQEDPLHRMFNAIQPGSYARPHRHLDPPKAEAWIVLQGQLLFITFLEDGTVDQHTTLTAGGECFGVDLVPGRYHTVCALVPDTVIYEVKTGPYLAMNDKAFAPWAPEEGSVEAAAYLKRLLSLAGT